MPSVRPPLLSPRAVAGAVAGGVLLLGACRQIADVGDQRAGGADPGSAVCQTAPLPPGPCEDCTVAACCSEVVACQTEAQCASIHACLAACENAFLAGTTVAKAQGLYGAGQDLLKDAFSGTCVAWVPP